MSKRKRIPKFIIQFFKTVLIIFFYHKQIIYIIISLIDKVFTIKQLPIKSKCHLLKIKLFIN